MSTASRVQPIRSYALRHYGNLISVEEPIFDGANEMWIAELKADYPVILHDDQSDRRFVKFLSMKKLGTLALSKDFRFLTVSTTREKCAETIRSFLKMWRDRAEMIVVRASSDQLVRIPQFRHFFTPVDLITVNLLEKDTISEEEIKKDRPRGRQAKLRQYLKLLEGLDLVHRIDGGYTYGNMFTMLRKEIKDEDKFREAILSYVIRERYPALREVFEISRLEPTIHVDSCYYKTALEAEEALYLTKGSIYRHFKAIYGRINPLELTLILKSLEKVDALCRKDKYYYGNEVLFDKMLEIKDSLPTLAPPSI